MGDNVGFIAVHVGAGYHSKEKISEYERVCNMACEKASNLLQMGKTALEALVVAIEILENSQITNAGIGSNLTLDGNVECDASVMDGSSGNFGAVAALSGIKNPIVAAKKLAESQSTLCSLGRVPPMMLCGEGAHNWAIKQGIVGISPGAMISETALNSFKKYSKHLKEEVGNKRRKIYSDDDCLFDTVGAICLDRNGNISAGVSSGGILLKYPGRVGQAAIYGAGCWATNTTHLTIGCSSSGCGEELIKTTLCKECGDLCMMSDQKKSGVSILQEILQKKFLESPYLSQNDNKLAGIMLLKYHGENAEIDFSWGHSTRSMIVGYMADTDEDPQFCLTRLDEQQSNGSSIYTKSFIRSLSTTKLFNL